MSDSLFTSVRSISIFLTESEALRLLDTGYVYFWGTYADVVSITKDFTLDGYWVKLVFLDDIYPLGE
jgi:hypothetical protein